MAENNNQMNCPMDCLRCSYQQRSACSAQMTRIMFGWMKGIESRLGSIEERLGTPDESLFNPSDKDLSFDKAQDGDGAENRSPKE